MRGTLLGALREVCYGSFWGLCGAFVAVPRPLQLQRPGQVALKRVGSNRLPYIRRRILNPWTMRQVPLCSFFRRDEVIEVQGDFMTSVRSCKQDPVYGPKGQTHAMRSEMSLDYCLPCTSFKIAVTALDALLTFINLFPESFVLLSLVQGFGCVCMHTRVCM